MNLQKMINIFSFFSSSFFLMDQLHRPIPQHKRIAGRGDLFMLWDFQLFAWSMLIGCGVDQLLLIG